MTRCLKCNNILSPKQKCCNICFSWASVNFINNILRKEQIILRKEQLKFRKEQILLQLNKEKNKLQHLKINNIHK
jgi:hypothetical protein